jgi:hypothetical protein
MGRLEAVLGALVVLAAVCMAAAAVAGVGAVRIVQAWLWAAQAHKAQS